MCCVPTADLGSWARTAARSVPVPRRPVCHPQVHCRVRGVGPLWGVRVGMRAQPVSNERMCARVRARANVFVFCAGL